jgi:hypothetical protein
MRLARPGTVMLMPIVRQPGMLYHVSEEPQIDRFDPRPSPLVDGAVVWAVDEEHLRNYVLPRECPRVTFYAGPQTTPTDRERFLGRSTSVVAIESGWVQHLQQMPLYCYLLPSATFECLDANAGYFVSRAPVSPAGVEVVLDPRAELAGRGVELRVLNDLWPVHDAVAASSLIFSMIRMRNARPRQTRPFE